MRKFFFTGLALVGVLVGSSACVGSDSASTAATTTSSSSPIVVRASTGTANTTTCSAKFSRYAELAEESAELIGTMDLTSRTNVKAILELADAAVETGRFLVRTCPSTVPAGFTSNLDNLSDGADELRRSL